MSESKRLTTLAEVRETLTGGSLTLHWWNPRKALSRGEKQKAAEAFAAKPGRLSGGKELLDKKYPAFLALTKAKGALRAWWEYNTLPYVVPGIRLVLRKHKDELWKEAASRQQDIGMLAEALEAVRYELIEQARIDLGDLFDDSAYPPNFIECFGLELAERSIDPPSYLATTNAEEYKKDLARKLGEIEASLGRFESQLWGQLGNLSARLTAGLAPGGKIVSSTLEGFSSVFDRVAKLEFEGTAVFREAMQEARDILDGVTAEDLRSSKGLRQEVHSDMEAFLNRFAQLKKTVEEVNSPYSEDSPGPGYEDLEPALV